jgi:hypothetical protein
VLTPDPSSVLGAARKIKPVLCLSGAKTETQSSILMISMLVTEWSALGFAELRDPILAGFD